MKAAIKPKSGQEIAEELNISRQAVSNSLKRAMRKCYHNIRQLYPTLSPAAASIFFIRWLSMVGTVEFDMNEIKKFNRLYPPVIRKEIEEDMKSGRQSFHTIIESVDEVLERAE
jgi:predicted DNA-binding protein YlxM (UPF0122 family)